MSFLPLYNIATFKNTTNTPKIAEVINVEDEEKLCRIKVKLEGLFDPEDEKGTNLPWISKLCDNLLYGSGDCMFSVPNKGDLVVLVWIYGEAFPCYRAIPYTKKNAVEEFNENYPNEWGWVDKGGFVFKINRDTNEYTLKTKKVSIKVDKDGNISIEAEKDMTVKAENVKVEAKKDVTVTAENATVEANKNVKVKASNVNIEADKTYIKGGNIELNGKTKIDGRVFLSHRHPCGDGSTGGVS